MTTHRKIAVTTGSLFIIATVAALAAAELEPVHVLNDAHPYQIALSACMYLLAAGTSAGIAIALYPLLTKTNPALALGAVIFRAIEAVFYTVSVLGLIVVWSILQQLVGTMTETAAFAQYLIDSTLMMRDYATLVGVMAFCVGAFMYYVVFYCTRLVPRFLSGWGIVGVLSMFTACILALSSGNPVTGYTPLILPILLQELVFAVWLLVKGFDDSKG